jgi:tetratricopeptide (TPR) repeat protein
MPRAAIAILIVLAVVAIVVYGLLRDRPSEPPPLVEAPVGATLLEGLQGHPFPVTSKHPDVQRWVDQAVMLTYGFNHDAAERSFLKAAELDPECAMCWWGAALVLGPHVNAGMDPANNAKAWDRLQRAQKLADRASPREQAYIRALSARYAENPPDDRRPLDEAYAVAASELAAQFPDDLDAATWQAEALMNLQPWDYYDEAGHPKDNTERIVAILESVMVRNADHAGALHLYIHATEASNDPQRAVAAADRLRGLVPGSGHLVHMPAHIYARVGRWNDAVQVNQDAIVADDLYLAACRPAPGVYPLGYVPHNHHFLWFAATMSGQRTLAMKAAADTAARTSDPDLMRAPGFAAMQHFWLTPLFAQVRHGEWDAIAAEPNPDEDLPYVTAIWHYARGLAAVRQQSLDAAQVHFDALASAAADPKMRELDIWERYTTADILGVAERVLAGELAQARGDTEGAVAALREAVKREDALPYDEPPGWHAPVRQTLGAVLLAAGRAAEAEAVYREELQRNPENGWSLLGLAQSLKAQGKTGPAAEVDQRFRKAWSKADFELTTSSF